MSTPAERLTPEQRATAVLVADLLFVIGERIAQRLDARRAAR